MNKIKIAFSGIGAVGGYYGGLLTARYQRLQVADIFFISRGENLRVIKENGLRVKTGIRTLTAIPTLATDNPAEIGPVDFLFCCTKSYDLEENLAQLSPVIGEETVIIPLLNGADIAERIQKLLPEHNVWKGCVYIGSRLKRPGYVEKFTGKEQLFFGKSGNRDKFRQQRLLKLLTNARINAINPTDIDTRIWKKFLMISAAATATSFFNKSIGEVMEQHIDMFIALCIELRSLAAAKGIILPDDIVQSSIEAQKMMPYNTTTSMHSDFLRGGPTELDTLTGYVIREAKTAGVEVPTFQFMYDTLTLFPYMENNDMPSV